MIFGQNAKNKVKFLSVLGKKWQIITTIIHIRKILIYMYNFLKKSSRGAVSIHSDLSLQS